MCLYVVSRRLSRFAIGGRPVPTGRGSVLFFDSRRVLSGARGSVVVREEPGSSHALENGCRKGSQSAEACHSCADV